MCIYFSCLIHFDTRSFRQGNHCLTRVYSCTKYRCVFVSIPVTSIPLFRFDDCTNRIKVLCRNSKEVIDMVCRNLYRLIRMNIKLDCHILTCEVWLVLTSCFLANINRILPNFDLLTIFFKLTHISWCTQCSVCYL